MGNSITTKYGTRINTTGLTPEQITRVRATAENRGAYGKKGATLADTFRKRNATKGPQTGGPLVAQPDPGELTPKGDPIGDTSTTVDNFLEGIFKGLKPVDLSGAPKILTDNDLQATRQSAYNSLYGQATKNLDRNKARELEAQKQELAERGIPYDPNDPNSLYGKTIGGVNERYDTLYSDAENQANLGADSRLQTLAGVNSAANDAFTKNAMAQFQSQLDAASTGGSILDVLMKKYGIDQATAQAKIDDATRRYIARLQNKPRGGGAPDTSQDPILGGGAPGWNL